MRKLTDYTPTKFMAKDSHYDADAADYAVGFIECLCHTKGTWCIWRSPVAAFAAVSGHGAERVAGLIE